MKKIIMTSTPYCYGPTSKLIYIAEVLSDEYKLFFAGSEPGLSLAHHGPFTEILEIKDRDNWNKTTIRMLKEADLLISFLEYKSIPIAKQYGVPTIFFDTLYWLRSSVPPFVEETEIYIAQRFFKPSSIRNSMRRKFVEVGPIIPRYIEANVRKEKNDENKSILVNFGGLHSPIMEPAADKAYVELVIQIIQSSRISFPRITLCLPKYMNHLNGYFHKAIPKAKILFLDTQGFHERLLSTSLLITQPGLEVVIEAMYIGVPIVFLPPHNGTQVIQAETYKQHKIPELYIRTKDTEKLEKTELPLADLTKAIQRLNIRLSSDHMTLDMLGCKLGKIVNSILSDVGSTQEKCNRNKILLRNLGEDGRKVTSEKIMELFNK